MRNFTPLFQLPLIPMLGLLWRMIDRRQKSKYVQNWRSINEKAVFALVATAIKKANYNLALAKIPPVSNIKELYIDPSDHVSIYYMAEGVLRSLKTTLKSQKVEADDLESMVRSIIMQNLNGAISYKLGSSKILNKHDYARNMQYAREQIERAKELGFNEIANQMKQSLNRHT